MVGPLGDVISYQLRQREYLLQISRAMTSRLDLPSLLRLILTSAADLVRAEAGLVALRRGQATTLTIQAHYGLSAVLLSLCASAGRLSSAGGELRHP